MRPANHNDCMLLHSWLNGPLVRKISLNPGQVPIKTLKRWFYVLIADKDVLLFTAELLVNDQWTPIAQIRVHDDGEIGISVHEEYRGKRLATPIILASLDFAGYNFSINKVFARIRCDNVASIRAFKRAGFRFEGEITVKGYPCVEYTYKLYRMAG